MADRAFARAALESYLRACEEHDERGTDGYLYAGALIDEMKGHARSKERIAELEAEVQRLRERWDAALIIADNVGSITGPAMRAIDAAFGEGS